MSNYEFKWLPELAWAVGLAVLTVLASSLAFDEPPDDWQAWGFTLAIALARAVVGASLDVARRVATQGPDTP